MLKLDGFLVAGKKDQDIDPRKPFWAFVLEEKIA
jgi:hypothetical protein